MRNTGKKLGMRCERFNWNFERTIWRDDDGSLFVKVNGCRIGLEKAKSFCDDWAILF